MRTTWSWQKLSVVAACALTLASLRGEAHAGVPTDRYVLDMANDTVTDTRTGLVWQRANAPSLSSWASAKTYCTGLGSGYRLPAFKELLTLVDPGRESPLDPKLFPAIPAQWYWSASPVVNNADYAWAVNFSSGGAYLLQKTELNAVRCVR